MQIMDEIKESFRSGSVLVKLIYVNIAVFIVVNLVSVVAFLSNDFFSLVPYLSIPAHLPQLAMKPWTMITYMFLHEGFIHILFNILWLYWFGTIFLRFFDERKLLGVYLLGGISGGLLFIIAYNIFPVFEAQLPVSYALGASAAVLAVVIATAAYAPDYTIYLLFLGPVKIKYIALISIVIDVISIASTNAGGHIAHLGGAFFGFIYASRYKAGVDLSSGIVKLLYSIRNWFKPGPRMRVTRNVPADDLEYNRMKKDRQEEIDRVLDKISQSGYSNLSKEEKELLFRVGKRE
jgi:membrane associated rhomboid family serine protease